MLSMQNAELPWIVRHTVPPPGARSVVVAPRRVCPLTRCTALQMQGTSYEAPLPFLHRIQQWLTKLRLFVYTSTRLHTASFFLNGEFYELMFVRFGRAMLGLSPALLLLLLLFLLQPCCVAHGESPRVCSGYSPSVTSPPASQWAIPRSSPFSAC